MKITKYLLIVMFTSLITACGSPELNTSTDETIMSSMQDIMSELSPEDQEKFLISLTEIYMNSAMSSIGSNKSPEEMKLSVNSKLDGKTAKEIFDLAN